MIFFEQNFVHPTLQGAPTTPLPPRATFPWNYVLAAPFGACTPNRMFFWKFIGLHDQLRLYIAVVSVSFGWPQLQIQSLKCNNFSQILVQHPKWRICISLINVLSLHCRKGGFIHTGKTSFLTIWLSVCICFKFLKNRPDFVKIIRHLVKNRCRIIKIMCRIIFWRSDGMLNLLNKS